MNIPIAIGKTPIFLIAPDSFTGTELALLLSLNVEAPKAVSKLYGNVTEKNHFFSNENALRVQRSIRKSGFAKPGDNKESVRLLIEESFHNGRLWGLQCDYELFFRANLYDLYEDARYIFVYDEPAMMRDADVVFLQQMHNFIAAHPGQCFVLQASSIYRLPDVVLQELPLEAKPLLSLPSSLPPADEEDNETQEADQEKHTPALPRSPIGHSESIAAAIGEAIAALEPSLLLAGTSGWFSGRECLFILTCSGTEALPALRESLLQIAYTFPLAPQVHVTAPDATCKAGIDRMIAEMPPSALKPVVHEAAHMAAACNNFIQQRSAALVVVDNLHLAPRYADLLKPFRQAGNAAPVFSFGKVSADVHTQANAHLKLTDFLTTQIIQDVMAFPADLCQRVGGFDTTLSSGVVLWDFSIRALQECTGAAAAISSVASAHHQLQAAITTGSLFDTPAYRQVIAKHQQSFEANFDHLLELLTQQQHLPQHEIRSLNQKISTMQALLKHSKNEVKAITDLSKALQKRIEMLENRWHYKLGAKIRRIKKIFFKKNTSGTGRLRKLLDFFLFTFSKPGARIVRKVSRNGFRKMYMMAEERPVRIVYLDEAPDEDGVQTYHDWIRLRQQPERISAAWQAIKDDLTVQPKISIVMPVYNPPLKYLKEAIESVIRQDYQNWELCMADDCSPGTQVRKLLNAYAIKDSRIKVHLRTENGHISASSNSALALATGDFVLLMDHDDLLSRDCLYEVVKHINEYPENDIIYSDEDKIDEAYHHSAAHFKTDWAPHSLLSRNYFGHVVVIRKNIIDGIGGFRLGLEGSQDYDLLLRATEASQKIGHIAKVLYHWRIHGKSAAQSEDVKPYAYIAARKALEEALVRRNTPGEVTYLSGLRGYRIRYDVTRPGKVSIIIPTKDQVKLLRNTLDSILALTSYGDYEIIVLNNNSSSKEFFRMMEEYTGRYPEKFRCLDANFPFNFAKLDRKSVAEATGSYILFLNNDVEVIHDDWLTLMVGYAQQPQTGAVGVKLLYPDDHIQHAGVIVGLGGVAGHAFVNSYKDDPGYFNYIQSVNNFSALTAACLLVRREVYEQVQGMDETFEVEYNDVDFCLKLIEAGYYNVYLPDVELYHYESATRGHPHQSKESWERHLREIKLFKNKWQKYIDNDPYYNPNLNIGAHDFSLDFSSGGRRKQQEQEDDAESTTT